MSKSDPFPADSPLVLRIEPSPNFGERSNGFRPDMLILHYPGMPSCEEAIRALRRPGRASRAIM